MECQERPDGLCKSLTGDGKIFGIGIRPLYVARAAEVYRYARQHMALGCQRPSVAALCFIREIASRPYRVERYRA